MLMHPKAQWNWETTFWNGCRRIARKGRGEKAARAEFRNLISFLTSISLNEG